jgi:hypothetical protein
MGAIVVAKHERMLYYGTAGTTAATQVLALVEVSINKSHDYDPTWVRGDGTTIPIMTEQAVMRKCDIKFKLRNEKTGTGAAAVAALIAIATHSSNPTIALKVVSYTSGATEFDGDVTLDLDDPDSRELDFTVHLSREGARAPSF